MPLNDEWGRCTYFNKYAKGSAALHKFHSSAIMFACYDLLLWNNHIDCPKIYWKNSILEEENSLLICISYSTEYFFCYIFPKSFYLRVTRIFNRFRPILGSLSDHWNSWQNNRIFQGLLWLSNEMWRNHTRTHCLSMSILLYEFELWGLVHQ